MKKRFLAKKYQKSITTPLGEVANLASECKDLINLSLGDPDFITDSKIVTKAFEDATDGHTKYTNALGEASVREALKVFYKKYYLYDINIDEMMMTVGACHGMYLILQAVLDEKDEVIIPEPYFTPYDHQVKMAGGKPVFVKTYEEENFSINIERLEDKITPKTKAIIVNNPNNPTGASLSEETLKAIGRLAQKHDLLIIADEVYGGFSFDKPFIPMTTFEDMRERTVTLGSFSKDYAMTGWRIGYVLAPEYLIQCIRDINEGICYCAPSISQRACIEAIHRREEILPYMAKEYEKRVSYAYERINKIPSLSVTKPQGTFYLFVNIKKTGLSSMEFCKALLEKVQVLVIPGNAFGESGEGYVRIACTVGVEQLKEAFDRIENIEF